MPKIENFNCDGICNEKACSDKYTHFIPIRINEIDLIILFCEKHHDFFQERQMRLFAIRRNLE